MLLDDTEHVERNGHSGHYVVQENVLLVPGCECYEVILLCISDQMQDMDW
jgi:hypothetical protein